NLVAGPDGNVWFAGGLFFGRMTPSGEVTKFPIGNFNRQATVIVVGHDRNLWSLEQTVGFSIRSVPNAIARITPTTGAVKEYPLHLTMLSEELGPIVAGPDGNIWFAHTIESTPSVCRVGRITPQGGIKEFTLPDAGCFLVGLLAGPDGNLWAIERPDGP